MHQFFSPAPSGLDLWGLECNEDFSTATRNAPRFSPLNGQDGFTRLPELTFDFGKFLPTESSFCAKLVVEPPFRNAPPDNFVVHRDFISPVIGGGKDDSVGTLLLQEDVNIVFE
jgi:hypothetical protein